MRSSVVTLQPGRAVDFRFDAPHGFDGTHRFELIELGPQSAAADALSPAMAAATSSAP